MNCNERNGNIWSGPGGRLRSVMRKNEAPPRRVCRLNATDQWLEPNIEILPFYLHLPLFHFPHFPHFPVSHTHTHTRQNVLLCFDIELKSKQKSYNFFLYLIYSCLIFFSQTSLARCKRSTLRLYVLRMSQRNDPKPLGGMDLYITANTTGGLWHFPPQMLNGGLKVSKGWNMST